MSDPHTQTRPVTNSAEDTKVCPFCAETIKRAAVVCRYCRRDLQPVAQSTPAAFELHPQNTRKQPGGCTKVAGYLLMALVIYGLYVIVTGSMPFVGNVQAPSRAPTATARPTPSSAQIKQSAVTVSYDSLARNTESHVGETVYFTGEVVQVIEDTWSDRVDLRVSVPDGDVLYVHYSGRPRVLEGDTIDLYAKVDGRVTYETVLGAKITIPEVTALVLTVVN
jgi:hypothetical protein